MVEIRKMIVSKDVAEKVTYGGTNTKTYLIIHETGNTNVGSNADAHGRLQANGNSRDASWQYTVDDKEVVQSFSDDAQCWGAGNSHYNKHGINIEICVNSDGDFKKAVENAADLTKQLMDKHSIPLKHVIQHHAASLKNCPRNLRSGAKGVTWDDFINLVAPIKVDKPPKPQVAPAKVENKPYTGNSIVTYLNSIGGDSSYANRSKLATKHSITGYEGTASQNLQLLAILRGDKQPKPKKSIALMAKEVVDGKHGNGHDARQKSLGISKAEYEKVRMEVNRILGSGAQKAPSFTIGSKVKIKSSAGKYSRSNSAIPARYKNKNFTIQQVSSDDVLIKELFSWVKKSDLQ